MEIVKIKIDKIKKYARNAKKHPQEQIDFIANSIKEFGFKVPILLDENFEIIAGHGRYLASKKLKIKELPCIIADDLTPEQIKMFRLADNKVAESEWDFDLLGLEIDGLSNLFNIGDFGFEFDIDEEKMEAKEDDYNVPDEITTDIVLGDLFEIGSHRLLCGDSTKKEDVEKLMNGEKADMVFTDPPFPNNSEIMHDMIKNIEDAFTNSRIYCSGLMIWFWDNLQFPPFIEMVTSKHIWHKTNGWQAGHFETMYCYHNDEKRHEQKVYSANNVGGENKREEQGNHPTPKPISLILEIIKDKKVNRILDLFLGSGSTMVAAHQLNRKCYGMEIDPKYCQLIIDRMLKLDPALKIKKNGGYYVKIY